MFVFLEKAMAEIKCWILEGTTLSQIPSSLGSLQRSSRLIATSTAGLDETSSKSKGNKRKNAENLMNIHLKYGMVRSVGFKNDFALVHYSCFLSSHSRGPTSHPGCRANASGPAA